MDDGNKSNDQLNNELRDALQRIVELEAVAANHHQIEKSLQERVRFLQSILDSIQDGINVLDKDLTIISANRKFQQKYAQMLPLNGEKCYQVFHGRSEPCEVCPSLRALKLQTIQMDEKPIKGTGGRRGWAEVFAVPLMDDTGNVVGVIEHIRDITKRQDMKSKLIASETMYRELFNNMGSGVAVYEVHGEGNDFIFKDFNHAGEKIDKVNKEFLIGKNVIEVFPNIKEFGLFDIFQRVWKTGKAEQLLPSYYADQRLQGWRENQVYKLPSGEIVSCFNDMTERKLVEEALQASEEKFRTLFQKANDAIFLHELTPDGRPSQYIEVNEIACHRLGYSRDELLKMTPLDINEEEHLANIPKLSMELMAKSELNLEVFHVTRNGSKIPVEINVNVFYINGKKVALAIARDITERKKTEELIREQREWFQVTLASIGDGVIATDSNGQVTFINKVAANLIGYSEAEILGRPIDAVFRIINEETRAPAEIPMNRVLRNGTIVGLANHTILIAKNGTEVPIADAAAPIMNIAGKVIGVVMVFHDISERNQAEAKLRASEEKFKNIYTQSPIGIGLCDIDGYLMDINKAGIDIFGILNQQEVIGFPLFNNPSIRPEAKAQLLGGYEVREEIEYDFETIKHKQTYRTAKSGKCYLDCVITPLKDEKGIRIGYLIQVQDITQRKIVEKELQESEERYRQLIELAPDAILVHSEGLIIFTNPALARMLQIANHQDLVGKRMEEFREGFIHPDFQQLFKHQIKSLTVGGNPVPLREQKLLRSDGEILSIETLASPLAFHGKAAVQIIIRDISDRKKLENESLKITKLEAVGLLAGGIAHDFNNILTIISGNTSLARLYIEANQQEKITQKLISIEQAVNRAQGLTQQLLTFAKGGAPIKTIGSIEELVNETTNFALSGSNVICDLSINDELWPVAIDEGQISQVINNLIINAVQAMPEGGKIRVKAENMIITDKLVIPLRAGNYVKISIQDEGIGIPDKYQQKIFDPYFTTKQKGSGLGLTTSLSIITKHDGYIAIESEVGVGTTFQIYLPASPENETPEIHDVDVLQFGKGKILLMDDEEDIRQIAGDMLAYLGYEVSFAKNGEEAIELFIREKRKGIPFDVVIMDLTVPGAMGGKEAINKLREIDSEIRAIVSSGYSNDPVLSNYRQYGFDDFVAKPYQINDLGEAVSKVITMK